MGLTLSKSQLALGTPARSEMLTWPDSLGLKSAYDLSTQPPVPSFNCTGSVSRQIMASIPSELNSRGDRIPKFNKVFFPMAYNADPFWQMGCMDGYLNHSYAPFVAMLYAIKKEPSWLVNELTGMIVMQWDYIQLKDEFNALFTKLREMRGGGRKGMASEDEFLRLGYLFFIISSCCDNSLGLISSNFGEFQNGWGGQTSHMFTSVKVKTIESWSRKLERIALSDLNWKNFFFRYTNQSDENSFWFFNFPMLDPYIFNDKLDTKPEDFFEMTLSYLKTLTSRGTRVLITVPLCTNKLNEVVARLSLEHRGDYLRSNELYGQVFQSLDAAPQFRMVLTNYTPTSASGFKLQDAQW